MSAIRYNAVTSQAFEVVGEEMTFQSSVSAIRYNEYVSGAVADFGTIGFNPQ